MLYVKMLNKSEIEEVLIESVDNDDNVVKHTDRVMFNPELFSDGSMYVLSTIKPNPYEDSMIISIWLDDDSRTIIPTKWVEYIKDEESGKKFYFLDSHKYYPRIINGKRGMRLLIEDKKILHKDEIAVCNNCGDTLTDSDKNSNDEGLCKSCFMDKYTKNKNYSYKPTPEFNGVQQKSDTKYPIWYGIELEIGYNNKLKLAQYMSKYNDVLYLKSDSSITHGTAGGSEIVSHPCSFKYLMDKDNWVSNLSVLDVVDDTENNGCHIHVSRTAFVDDKHYAMVYHLMTEMGEWLQTVGGREFTGYCQFDSKETPHIARIKKEGTHCYRRQNWVNDRNSSTVEFRFFASSVDPKQIKRYIQFLDSLIKYTRYHSKMVSVEGWVKYCIKYSNKYTELVSFLQDNTPPLKRVVYRLPKYKKYTVDTLPFRKQSRVEKIETKDGKVYEVKYTGDIEWGSTYLYTSIVGEGHMDISYTNIKYFYVTKE